MSKQTELAQVADTITVNSGNVGIGTSSPAYSLVVSSGGASGIEFGPAYSGTANLVQHYSRSGNVYVDAVNVAAQHRFFIGGTERMRINSSGNLLVGKTSADISTVGHEINGNGGYASHTRSGNTCLYLNRTASDGDIAVFRKDGSTVGSIGNIGTHIYIGGTSASGLFFGGSRIQPISNGSLADNLIDMGHPSYRFDDIYATNGTIQTSDRNEKQDIAELSDAEQRVAVAAKGLLRKFRWKDAVAEKGDNARIHFGIIAQDLQAAFAAEGLDAGDYAMFISSTWWEHDVEVPAVEAVAEVTETTTDEDGNEVVTVVTEAVEAVDAYTRTDTYDTQEEAPEGATERTRLGVRYSELLAFIIGAL